MTEEKQFPEEFLLPSADPKVLQSLPQEVASSTLEMQVEMIELKKLQSVIRGFIDRQQFKNINHLKADTHECNSIKSIKTIQEIPYNKISDFLNPSTSKLLTQLGPFHFNSDQNPSFPIKGPVLVDSQAIFIGQWDEKGFRHGQGTQYWPDGSIYEGEWENDKANGRGRLIHANGDVYEGRWENGRANGFGIYLHHYGRPKNKDNTICGARYEGEWKNDKQHGKGLEFWPDGSKFSGYYDSGLKHGKGRFEWSEGSVYEGDFFKNNIQGQGEYIWSDGRVFKGSWKDNKMHGFGIFQWSDGRKYEGEYLDDKKHGFGIFTWKDGRKYEGSWNNGKQHGQGVYTCSNGISKQGVWHHGKKVQVIDFVN
jgi:hypothetical protein